MNLAGGGPDLFVEIVHFEETRDYIRSVHENYIICRSLFGMVS